VRLTTLPCKKEIVEKPPRNAVGFCGGGHGLSWAVEPSKERKINIVLRCQYLHHHFSFSKNFFYKRNFSYVPSHHSPEV